ncbi:hypothetical protein HHI36_003308 [Cryptolaemus montrouzieri]|uniref:Acyltransferase 3 domain-containing protein n=1 Tax=Cryptolaemus montrouzieri TaxID=559131 RepID=A0ABD2PE01_9CUCU
MMVYSLFSAFTVFFLSLLFSDYVSSLVTERDYAHLPPVFKADDFDRCMLLGKSALYCTIEFQLAPLNPKESTDGWKQIEELSRDERNYRHDILRHGICIPFTCPNISIDISENSNFKNELADCYSRKFGRYDIYGTITRMHCQTNEPPSNDIYDLLVIYSLIVYVIFLILVSLYETLESSKFKQRKEQATGSKFAAVVHCFSIQKNWHRLTSGDSSTDESLKCIYGVKFYSMFVVISGHALMGTLHGPIINPRVREEIWNTITNKVTTGLGSLFIENFFVMSSLFLTLNLFQKNEKKSFGMADIFRNIVDRYLRLTPTMAIMLVIHCSLSKYTAKGPFWYHLIGEEFENCRRNGWTNFLYINNYVNSSQMCFSQTWYLAADMQLYIMGLVVIYMLKKFPKQMVKILGVFFIIGISIPGIVSFMNNCGLLLAYPERSYTIFLQVKDWHLLYSSGYSNIGASILGIIFGVLYREYYDKAEKRIFTTKIRSALFWILSIGLYVVTIYASFFVSNESGFYNNLINALWWSAAKTAVSISFSVFIYGLVEKKGGLFLTACRWKPAYYLSKLNYSAFLVHVFVGRVKAASIRSPIYISDYVFVTSVVELISMTYIFALVLCIAWEMPFNTLRKMCMGQDKKKMEKPSIEFTAVETNPEKI